MIIRLVIYSKGIYPQQPNNYRLVKYDDEISRIIVSEFYIGVLKKGPIAVLITCTGAGRFVNNSNWEMACSIRTSNPLTKVQPLDAFCRIDLKRFVSSR